MLKTFVCALLVSLAAPMLPAGPPVGWRTDGSGRYPDADPPTEWSASKSVVWKCPMPSWSNSTPVIVGDKVFVCSEPTDLVCVSKADGKILWKQSNNYDLVMTPEEKAQAEKDLAEAKRIRKDEIGPLERQRQDAEQELRKLQPPKPANGPASAPSAEVKAAQDLLKQKMQDCEKQINALRKKAEPLTRWEMPGTHDSNGQSSATPVSDGKVVAAVFNNGLAVCYDLDGKLKWAKFIAKPPHTSWGACSSPLIYQDKLLVHFVDMVALDLATGNEAWKAPKTEWRWGTPIITRVGELDVVVTAAGDVVRLSDGKVLAAKLQSLEYNAPIIQDNVAYFAFQKGCKAVKLAPKGPDGVEATALWTTPFKDERYYASPLINDGLVYAINQARNCSILNAADGKLVAEKTLALGDKTVYPSITLAGKYVFLSNEDGTTLVMEPGKEFKEVAKNKLEPFRCSPVFEGKRMYIRGYKNLWCIGQ